MNLKKNLNNIDKNINEIMRHAEKKCCKLQSTARNEYSVRFGEKLKQLHLARNKKNRLRNIMPGQSFAEAVLNYKQALDEYDEARKAYDEIKKMVITNASNA